MELDNLELGPSFRQEANGDSAAFQNLWPPKTRKSCWDEIRADAAHPQREVPLRQVTEGTPEKGVKSWSKDNWIIVRALHNCSQERTVQKDRGRKTPRTQEARNDGGLCAIFSEEGWDAATGA